MKAMHGLRGGQSGSSWRLGVLGALLLAALAVEVASLSTTTPTSPSLVSANNTGGPLASTNESHVTPSSNHSGHGDPGDSGHRGHKKAHSIHVLALEFEVVKEPLIFTVVVLLAGLSKILFHHADFLSSKIPESCMLIGLGTIFGAILHFSGLSDDLPDLFEPHMFFVFLLPPIILESAYSLYDRTFSENLGTVLLFAVVGTIISFFLVGLTLYGLMLSGAMGTVPQMTLVQILVFAALIVAVDPVAVLAVFTEIGVNDVLYFIVFGESLLNDGVTVVLYKVMQTMNLMEVISAGQVMLAIVKFLVVCFGGLFIGVVAGVVSAALTRKTVHVGVTQPLVIYTMAYLGFLLSELIEVSGIISIIGCGLVQRHYAFPNISHKSRTTVKYFTKVLASASEIIIFLFLGLELVSDTHDWNTGFVLWTLLLCTAYRFLVTFGIACLVNRFDTMRVRLIGYDEMFMIAFGGLRGAVAFSLAALLDEGDLPMKHMFVTTTMAIVIFTVFFQGITIKPLVSYLSIKLAPEKNESMYCELSSHVTDHLMAGIENVVGIHGRNFFRERIEQLDQKYFRKMLMNEPDPADASLEDFYNKIVIKEHYKNLKLCGAANVPECAIIPHIDTELYLNTLTKDHDGPHELQRPTSLPEDHETGTVSPVLRRRRTMRSSTTSSVPGDDLTTFRNLLQTQRTSRLNLHATHDRNLTFDLSNDFQAEVIKRSAHNRRLEHIMSVARPMLARAVSWKEKDSHIAVQRSAQASTSDTKGGAGKRAISLDLGVTSAAYSHLSTHMAFLRSECPGLHCFNRKHGLGLGKRAVSLDLGVTSAACRPLSPRGSQPGTPGSPNSNLDSVFEENEDGVPAVTTPGLLKQEGIDQGDRDGDAIQLGTVVEFQGGATPLDVESQELVPLMGGADAEPVSSTTSPSSSEDEGDDVKVKVVKGKKGKSSKASRHHLKRQNDLKPSDDNV